MAKVVAEVKRVSRRGYYFSVPFAETPLPRHHKQTFDMPRLMELFPDASFEFLSSGNTIVWVSALVEHSGASGMLRAVPRIFRR